MVLKMMWPLLSVKCGFRKEKASKWLLFNVVVCPLLAESCQATDTTNSKEDVDAS